MHLGFKLFELGFLLFLVLFYLLLRLAAGLLHFLGSVWFMVVRKSFGLARRWMY